jgi:hypothetical protein
MKSKGKTTAGVSEVISVRWYEGDRERLPFVLTPTGGHFTAALHLGNKPNNCNEAN